MFRTQVEPNALQMLTIVLLRLYLMLSVVGLPSLRLISCDASRREPVQYHGSGLSDLCW